MQTVRHKAKRLCVRLPDSSGAGPCCRQMGGPDIGAARRRSGAVQPDTSPDRRYLAKVLSQTLKSLERDGLVSRKAIPTVPVTVEYSITPLGKTLSATVDGLRVWAETHIDKVLKAQKQYDAGCNGPPPEAGPNAVRARNQLQNQSEQHVDGS